MAEKKKQVPREDIPWYPSIDKEKCTECGICVEFCKHGVYATVDEKSEVVNPYNCIVGCKGCENQCPEQAISFPSMKDISELLKKLRTKHEIE